MAKKQAQPIKLADLKGREWKAIVNGRRSLNGPRHSIRIFGCVEDGEGDETLFDVAGQLIDHIRENTSEMEYPDSIQITIMPPGGERED